MKYPDYPYVDVAVNGAYNRNKVCKLEKLGDPTGFRDTFMTYFRFPEALINHFNQNVKTNKWGVKYHSVTGYQGPAYCDWIPIDIDAQDLQQAIDETNRLVENMEEYGVDPNACRFYFSGSKGFHILIPSEMAGVEPSEDIHIRIKNVVRGLAGNIPIDSSIYDKMRLFRLPNTINEKSGLYKIELYPFEIQSVDQILEMARNPREELFIEEEFDLNDQLHEWYKQEQPKKQTKSTGEVNKKVCLHKMMKGVPEGNRDNIGVRVASHLKHSGLNGQMVWVALDEWNNHNDPPLETYELERIYDQGFQQYDFGCNDELLKMYCDPKCIFFKDHMRTEAGRGVL